MTEIAVYDKLIGNCGAGPQSTKRQQTQRSQGMRRAALYARVSTRRQEQEATIESQIAQLLAYAEEQGYSLLPEHRFIDQAVSGRHLARPGLDRLRDTALLGVFDVLLCLSPDRLARSLGAQQVVLDELRQLGVEVVFVNQPTLGDSPHERLLLNVEGAFAEYERTVISERMRRGRLYSLRQGRSVPTQAPYGYRYRPALDGQASRWVVVAEEAAVVEQMFVWYTQHDISLGQLARRLNDDIILSPEGKGWYASTIGRLLRQPAYKGIAYYARYRADYSAVGQPRCQGQGTLCFPRYKLRPSEEWIEIAVPALVDETTWQAAQERLQMKARFAQRNSQRTYLLRGLLVCGVCQHTLQGRTQRGVVYYICTHGGVHCPPGVARHTCSVRGDVVEPLVWQSLSELLRNPQHIQAAWEALQAEEVTTPSEAQRCKQRETLLRKQRGRLLDAYQTGILSLEELIERQNPLHTELKELQRKLTDASPSTSLQISLDAFTKRIEQALAASDVQTRQEVLRLLIERIVVTDDTLTVEHVVPTVGNDSRLHTTFHESRNTTPLKKGESKQIFGMPTGLERANPS
jgi:site-specific DNA recombinase